MSRIQSAVSVSIACSLWTRSLPFSATLRSDSAFCASAWISPTCADDSWISGCPVSASSSFRGQRLRVIQDGEIRSGVGVVPFGCALQNGQVVRSADGRDHAVVSGPPVAGPIDYRRLAKSVRGEREDDSPAQPEFARGAEGQEVRAARRRADDGGSAAIHQERSDALADDWNEVRRESPWGTVGVNATPGEGQYAHGKFSKWLAETRLWATAVPIFLSD
jgi:ElaB/YqjD/DUF883 family membrane-anchored ribosome-binding protein